MSFALGSDGFIYVVSGVNTTLVTDVYRYNPSTNTWTSLANIPGHVWEGAAASTSNGKLFVFGGEPSGGEEPTAATRIYNIATNKWSKGANIPIAVKQHSAVTGADGKIYLIGGRAHSWEAPTGTVQIYDPLNDVWSVGAPMLIPKGQFGAVLASNGKIYVIGGKVRNTNGIGPFFHTVEIYDPISNSWAEGPVIRAQVGELEAVSHNGNLYSVGGTDSTSQKYNFQLILPPLAPFGLTATSTTSSQIFLKWKDGAQNETNYLVERATASVGPFEVTVTLNANSKSYYDTNVTGGNTYYYRVRAINSAGNSNYSNIDRATTPISFASADSKSVNIAKTSFELVNKLSIWPNPVNKFATISFSVDKDQKVQLLVYNMEGKPVDQVFSGEVKAGKKYQFGWSPRWLASGLYITKLITNKEALQEKFIVLPQ